MFESFVGWLMGLSPLWTSLGLFFVLLFVLFLGNLVAGLFGGNLRVLALAAVRYAELAVIALPEEKWKIALDYIVKAVKAKFGIPLPRVVLERLLVWALAKIKENGEEIKASSLGIDKKKLREGLRLKLPTNDDGSFRIDFNKTF